MGYWALSFLEHGKEPSVRAVTGPSEAVPGEAVVNEAPAPGLVWDEATNALREKGEAEKLEEAKAARVEEFARRGIDDLAPLFTPGVGRDETALLIAGHVLKICTALGIAPDPRLTAVVETGQKALAKKAEVEGAASVEEVEAVAWT